MSAPSPSAPLETRTLEAHSASRGEPGWLAGYRKERLASFLESPSNGGRYTRLKLDWRGLEPAVPSFPAAEPPEGLLPATGKGSPMVALAPWALENPERFSDLVRPRQPFDHLAFASWSHGLLFRWPPEGGGEAAYHLAPEPKPGLLLEPMLLDVGAGAKGKLVLEWGGSREPGLRLTALTGRVAAGASLDLVLLGEGGEGHHHLSVNLDLGEGAHVNLFGAWLGGRWTVVRTEAALTSPGASWRETHLVWGAGKDHCDVEARVLHLASHTRSDVHARAALDGSARSVFTGNVIMEKEALQADAKLEDHALLLSDRARSDSIPGLIIRAMDVKASHAASAGQLDREALFYLLSRGLSEPEARHLLVKGFLETLSGRAPFPAVPLRVDEVLERRVR